MKKISLFAIMMAFVTMVNFAKENNGGFGVKGGIGLTTIGFEEESASDQKNRMKLGGFASASYEKRIGKVFALDMEVGYANKGVQVKENYDIFGNKGTFTAKYNLHSIEVPLTAKFYIGDNFNINVGPYASYFFAGKTKLIKNPENGDKEVSESENLYNDTNNPKDAEGDRFFQRYDVGANVGLEFVSDMGLGVGGRFQKGFVDYTNKNYAINDDKYVTHTGVQVYAIFRF